MSAPNVSPTGFGQWIAEQVIAAGSLSVQLLDTDYVFDPTDVYLSDIPSGAKVDTLTPIDGSITVDADGWVVTDTDTTTISTVSNPDDLAGLAITFDDGVGDRLAYIVQARGDRTLIAVTPDGGSIDITFVDGQVFRP